MVRSNSDGAGVAGMQKSAASPSEEPPKLYGTNKEASEALGIHPTAFGRACRKYGIETPNARKLRLRKRESVS